VAADSFVHLHVHSEYSMLDGAARVGELIQKAKDEGMPAVAVTDHGNVFGAYDFWKQATDAGIKPIIGTEAYLTPGTHRSDKTRVRWGNGGGDDVSGSGAYTHMTLLSETTEGMHNLFRLSSLASIEGYYFKPRMDRELLQTYSNGLIATTGCPSGEVQTRLRLGQYDEAVKAASDYRDIFGKENFFAEIMDHGLGIERRIMDDLLRLAKQLDLPLLGTNDLHYTHAHPTGSSSTPTTSTSSPRPRCGTSSATTPRRATTRCSSPSARTCSSTPARTSCRASPCPRGRARRAGS
jgi:DNA polymerase-3 subunit alpha